MAIAVSCLALLHAAAFAGVLLLAKYSVALVDEEGRPLAAASPWQERVVRSRQAPASHEV